MSSVQDNSDRGRVALLAGITALIVLVAGVIWVATRGVDNRRANLDAARAQWEQAQIEDYQYILKLGCFCPPDRVQPVLVEVRDGELRSIVYADGSRSADRQFFSRYVPMGALFDALESELESDPERFEISYDSETGAPVDVFIDVDGAILDEQLSLTITNFQIFEP